MFSVYCAGPITGYTGKEVFNHFDYVSRRLKILGFKVLHPMIGKDEMRRENNFKSNGYSDNPLTTDNSIISRDIWAVKQCDILLADFTLGKDSVSIGTSMEIAWGMMLGKLIITVLPKENIHNHAFILQASSVIYPTLDEALEYLALYGN